MLYEVDIPLRKRLAQVLREEAPALPADGSTVVVRRHAESKRTIFVTAAGTLTLLEYLESERRAGEDRAHAAREAERREKIHLLKQRLEEERRARQDRDQQRRARAEVEDQRLREERSAIERTLAGMTDVAEDLRAQQRQRLAEMQQLAVELAITVAGQLVHQRIAAGAFGVESLVQKVVDRLETTQAVTVYLHPDDVTLLEQRLGEGRPLLENNEYRLVGDPSLGRGDCRAETDEHSIHAHLEQQIADIRKHLLQHLPDAEVERRHAAPRNTTLRHFPERRHSE